MTQKGGRRIRNWIVLELFDDWETGTKKDRSVLFICVPDQVLQKVKDRVRNVLISKNCI